MPGPLDGVRVVELAGIGPAPFGCMLLADMGADVVRIDRAAGVQPGTWDRPWLDPLARGRRSVGVDLKHPDGADLVLRLVAGADVLVEGFRPGVAERLGVGPDECLQHNPRLVYARMTGWGQHGPLAPAAGHDIDYIALAGALAHVGRAGEPPVPPLNLVGDFGGGGMLLAFGVVCALLEARASGSGQVIDAAMVDGASLLMTMIHGLAAAGAHSDERGTNMLDTGAPFYEVYECADGRHLAVGAIEPQFYAELRRLVGLDGAHWDDQMDRAAWPARKQELAAVFRTRARDEWCALLEGTDACVAPVLTMTEAASHPHAVARDAFAELDGMVVPAPAPRFDRTPGGFGRPPAHPGRHTDEVLAEAGLDAKEIDALRASGAIA